MLSVAIGLCFLLPTGESLWYDECFTYHFVSQPDLASLWRELNHSPTSERQMPVALLLGWLFEKILGSGEWALRAPNILWGTIAVTALYRIGRRLRLAWLPLLLVIQPFFAFYMNEARPYALQIAMGACLTALLIDFSFGNAPPPWWKTVLFWAAGFILAGSSLIASLLLTPFAVAWLWRRWQLRYPVRAHEYVLGLVVLALFAGLGLYYVQSMTDEAGGYKGHVISVSTLAFVWYDFLGFSGLGPDRFQLRQLARSGPGTVWEGLKPYFAVQLLLALAYLHVIVQGLVAWRRSRDKRLPAFLGLLLGGGFVAVLVPAHLAHFAPWARHFSPLFPLILLLLALLMARARSIPSRLAVGVLVLLLAGSTLRQYFDPAFRKEDYRAACAFARERLNEHRIVWMFAEGIALRYYQVPAGVEPEDPTRVFLVPQWLENSPTPGHLPALRPPEWFIIADRMEMENHSLLSEFIRNNGLELERKKIGFSVYRKPNP